MAAAGFVETRLAPNSDSRSDATAPDDGLVGVARAARLTGAAAAAAEGVAATADWRGPSVRSRLRLAAGCAAGGEVRWVDRTLSGRLDEFEVPEELEVPDEEFADAVPSAWAVAEPQTNA